MSRRKPLSYEGVQYSKLGDTVDGINERAKPQINSQVPWKAIGLALALFSFGLSMLLTGILIFSGHVDTKYGDRMWPLIILGALMFIPGAYHVRIAYYAYRQVPGYSFQDIPEFDG